MKAVCWGIHQVLNLILLSFYNFFNFIKMLTHMLTQDWGVMTRIDFYFVCWEL